MTIVALIITIFMETFLGVHFVSLGQLVRPAGPAGTVAALY